MNKRILELIYEAYLEEITESPVSNLEEPYPISNETKKKIMEMFKTPIEKKKEKKEIPVEVGQVRLFFKNHVPVYYLILDHIDENLYEVLKISSWIELANNNDYIFRLQDELYVAEIWNNFYLTGEEIESSIFIGEVSDSDLDTVVSYRKGKIKKLPKDKRGLKAPIGNNIQTKFHEKESEIVRPFKFRIFTD